jgi:hypothetical protein
MSTDEPEAWAAHSCTLPTVRRPLREAEFDELFAAAVRRIDRPERTRLSLELEPAAHVASRAADLVVRETSCCSFFTFALTATGGALRLDVSVPDGQIEVLDGLAARAGTVAEPRG